MVYTKTVLVIVAGMGLHLFAMEHKALNVVNNPQRHVQEHVQTEIKDDDIPLLLVRLKYYKEEKKTEPMVYEHSLNAEKNVPREHLSVRCKRRKNSPLDLRSMKSRYALKDIVNFSCPFIGCEYRAFTSAESLGSHLSKLHRDAFLSYDVSYAVFIEFFTKK